MLHIDLLYVNFIAGALLPFLTGLLTKQAASSGLKAIVSFVLAGMVAVLELFTKSAGVVDWKSAVVAFFFVLVTHAGVYYGLWRPTGVTGAVQSSTANVGIG